MLSGNILPYATTTIKFGFNSSNVVITSSLFLIFSGWNTGIRDPKNPDSAFALKITVSDTAVVTSGSYERYFTVDGVKYPHIIDKDTLYPATYYDSLTVVTKDSGLADCLSTALYCMPLPESRRLAESLDGVECIWIESDGTDGIKNLIV